MHLKIMKFKPFLLFYEKVSCVGKFNCPVLRLFWYLFIVCLFNTDKHEFLVRFQFRFVMQCISIVLFGLIQKQSCIVSIFVVICLLKCFIFGLLINAGFYRKKNTYK